MLDMILLSLPSPVTNRDRVSSRVVQKRLPVHFIHILLCMLVGQRGDCSLVLMWQFTGASTAWNIPAVLVECYFFSRNRGLLAHSKRKMYVTYAKMFRKKGRSWILYSGKHLFLRLLRWKLFSPPPTVAPMLYRHRGVTSAVQQVSYYFRIYKGSKASDFFFLKCLGALACFLFFWQLYILQFVCIVDSCLCSKTIQPSSRKAKRGRSTCGALCPVSTLFPT